MDSTRHRLAAQILRGYQSGRMPRREALRLLGALGLTTAGLGAIGLGAVSTRSTSAGSVAIGGVHAGHGGLYAALLRQDAGTPEPASTPLTFLSGEEVPPLIIPDESAGTPAAGPPTLMINPAAAFPSGQDTYDGTGYVNSGLDVIRLPGDPPFMLTFTKPGTYEYQCIPHGVVMKATVVVQEAGSAHPEDQATIDARGDQERAALVEEGMAEIAEYAEATATARDDGTTLWEIAAGAGEGQARVMQFLPNALEIKAGDTVRWVNHSKTEPHTVTFLGEGVEQPEDIAVEPQPSGPPKIIQNPLTLFPQGGQVFNGEGYVNSGR
ncbi:MAG: blue (type 1) copper domain protein [Thermomicrobiales bacterium]|nr:blue (type 1) copper domain protein [Thermomicrobiales bacterium]